TPSAPNRSDLVTLTTRLSLFFLAAVAVVLAAFSATLYALAHHHLHQQLDDRLAASARTLAAAIEVEPHRVEWEPPSSPHLLVPRTFGEQLLCMVINDTGLLIARSSQPDCQVLLDEADRGLRFGHRNPRRFEYKGRAWQAMQIRVEPEVPPTSPLKPE